MDSSGPEERHRLYPEPHRYRHLDLSYLQYRLDPNRDSHLRPRERRRQDLDAIPVRV